VFETRVLYKIFGMKAIMEETARENSVGIGRGIVEIPYENVNSVQSNMGVCGDRRTFSFHSIEFLD
jgi:hypothetical protein